MSVAYGFYQGPGIGGDLQLDADKIWQRWTFFHKLAKRKMSLILKEAQRTKAQCVFETSEAQRTKAQRVSEISEAQRNLRNPLL